MGLQSLTPATLNSVLLTATKMSLTERKLHDLTALLKPITQEPNPDFCSGP